jgi:hypothetical protein
MKKQRIRGSSVTEVYEVLEGALAIVERRGGWTQFAFCRAKKGDAVFGPSDSRYEDVGSNRYCALGALCVVDGVDPLIRERCLELVEVISARLFRCDIEEVAQTSWSALARPARTSTPF